jgi:hypothetical protein
MEADEEVEEFLVSKNLLNETHEPRKLEQRKGKYRNSMAHYI